MGKIIRVNVTGPKIKEEFNPAYDLLGGRALTSRLILSEVEPACHPLSADNKICLAPGLLTGTGAPCSGRLSVGAKSPLTGTIKESNVGGSAGHAMAVLGIKALVIEGSPSDKWYVLVIDASGARLEEASRFVGLTNYELAKQLQTEYGEDISIISVGPAGEQALPVASIAVTNREGKPSRHAGRGGMGAVLGSKKIKAIVIKEGLPSQVQKAAENQKYRDISTKWAKELVASKKALTNYGTAVLVNLINNIGGMPTLNFSQGTFKSAKNISGEQLALLCEQRGGKLPMPVPRAV